MNNELKVIKKKYGEAMMHFCRKSFPTILNQKNVLLNILLRKVGHTPYLFTHWQVGGFVRLLIPKMVSVLSRY